MYCWLPLACLKDKRDIQSNSFMRKCILNAFKASNVMLGTQHRSVTVITLQFVPNEYKRISPTLGFPSLFSLASSTFSFILPSTGLRLAEVDFLPDEYTNNAYYWKILCYSKLCYEFAKRMIVCECQANLQTFFFFFTFSHLVLDFSQQTKWIINTTACWDKKKKPRCLGF